MMISSSSDVQDLWLQQQHMTDIGAGRASPDFSSAYTLATQLHKRGLLLCWAWTLFYCGQRVPWTVTVKFIL
jgi:hypothetical protein